MIELSHVSVTFKYHAPALADVSVAIAAGEFVFLVGPSGAGKSTFLKLLYRETRPSSGEVTVNGQRLNAMRQRQLPFLRRRLGIVFQDFGLLPNQTVRENVAFALRVTGARRETIDRQVPHVLNQVGMAHRDDAFPHQLSGGEQQRIAIARALVHDPILLLADEPTGNLDPDTSQEIGDLLADIHAQGTTVLVATHDAMLVDRMARRVLAFERGQLIRDESPGRYRAESVPLQAQADETAAMVEGQSHAEAPHALHSENADGQPDTATIVTEGETDKPKISAGQARANRRREAALRR